MRRSIEIDAYVVVKVNVASDRSTMGSGGGVSRKGLTGKKRKAAGGRGSGEVPATRQPKRGLGVAELEMIRAQLEKADSFYMVPSLSTPVAAPPPPLVGHLPGVRHDQCVGNGAVRRDDYIPYYGAQHYTNGVLPSISRFLASNGQAFNQADQNVVTAIHPLKQPASSEESYKLRLQDHRRRPQPQQRGQMRRPQVAFVDLVDSDDEDAATAAAVEELDLELKL